MWQLLWWLAVGLQFKTNAMWSPIGVLFLKCCISASKHWFNYKICHICSSNVLLCACIVCIIHLLLLSTVYISHRHFNVSFSALMETIFGTYIGGKGEREVVCGQVWWPILGICPLHLTHPSAHSQQWTHTWSSILFIYIVNKSKQLIKLN